MKLIINKSELNESPELWLRRTGYSCIRNGRTGGESFVRRLGRDYYPRFHIYIQEEDGHIVFNLHLDQKRPSYSGIAAHNAEYEGEAVEKEIERLKQFITHNS